MVMVQELDFENVLTRPRVDAWGDVAQSEDFFAVGDEWGLG